MGWLQDYLDYTKSQESPPEFHLWCGVAAIASALNRRVWLPRTSKDWIERYRAYPGQIQTVLVAGAAHCRKSTAVNMIQPIMESAGVRVFEGKITPESLLQELARLNKINNRAIMTIVNDELEYFLSKASYAEMMVSHLLRLTDCKGGSYQTKGGGRVELGNEVCLTSLFATTPASLGRNIPTAAHEVGWLSRYFWVFSDRPGSPDSLTGDSRKADQTKIIENMQLRTKLIQGLRKISELQGEVLWTDEARGWYNDWYLEYSKTDSAKSVGWGGRRHEHLVRLGMVLSIAEHIDMTIHLKEIEQANVLLTRVEANFHKAFAFIGRHGSAENQDRVLDVFRRAKKSGKDSVTNIELYTQVRQFFPDINTLRACMTMLQMAGIIQCEQITHSRNGTGVEEKWKMVKEPF